MHPPHFDAEMMTALLGDVKIKRYSKAGSPTPSDTAPLTKQPMTLAHEAPRDNAGDIHAGLRTMGWLPKQGSHVRDLPVFFGRLMSRYAQCIAAAV